MDAMQAMLSEYDYFTPTVLQSTITAEFDEAIGTVNSISAEGNGSAFGAFEFNIPGATDLYRDLNNSYLVVKLKVVAADGTNLAGDVILAPVNNAMHSLFSSVSVTLCGKEITEKDSYYPYRAYLEKLLTFDPNVLATRGAVEGWYKDDAGEAMERLTIAKADGQPLPNAGFVAREKLLAGSRTFTFVGRPHVDLFHQNLDIPPGCGMTIRFTPSTAAFALIGANANAGALIRLLGAKLYVRTKRVCPEMVLAHRDMLDRCNIRIPHNRVTVNRYAIAAGITSTTVPLNFPAKLPKRIVVGFVTNAAATGSVATNPYYFQNFGLTELVVRVNGTSIPADGLAMNYATGEYQRAYMNTLSALGLDVDNRAIALTPEEFASGFNLYAYKIATGPIDGTVHCAANSCGSLSVSLKFAAAHAAALDMIVFAETPALLEIDKLSSVTLV